ncbi:MAG TPA: hypothetical protein VE567_03500 [Sphingomonas sp.]|nr:hypothetical protein [Sphingomonas sp.]
MVDDRPEDIGPLTDPDRPKRAPPTIDLQATQVSSEPSSEPPKAGEQPQGEGEPEAQPEGAWAASSSEPSPQPAAPEPLSKPISPWAIAPISGAVAAALVIGVGWLLGWPAVQTPSPAAPQVSAAAVDELTTRVASLETKANRAAPATDGGTTARIDALEKSIAALRGEVAASRAQSEKLAAAINEVKALPRDSSAPAPDLSGINERIARIDSAVRAQAAALAQQGSQLAAARAADAKPVDDLPLRRVVAASLLDVAVRHGDPFAARLAAAKAVAEDADALKPLEPFAASGIPSAAALCRELLEIVPKLMPAAPNAASAGSGIIDRLQAGAAKLVRIQRTDAGGTDRASVVARITAAALRNDLNTARNELKTLEPADRAPAHAWIDKVDARDAALAASRKFADGAMAALATANQ